MPAKTIIILFLLLASVCGCFFVTSRASLFLAAVPTNANILPASLADATNENNPAASGALADISTTGSSGSLASAASVTVAQNQTKIDTQVTVYDADEVLLYLEGGVLPAALYLGRAVYQGDGAWTYGFDLNRRPLPNGNYRIYAQVTKNSLIFDSVPADLVINIKNGADTAKIAAVKKTIQETNLAIEVNDQAITAAVKTATGSVSAKTGAAPAAIENISQVAALTQTLEQLNRDLAEAILARQAVNDSVRLQQEEIASLSGDTIASIRAEKMQELVEAKDRAKELDKKISDLQKQIQDTKDARLARVENILALAAAADKGAVNRALVEMEGEISKQAMDTIAKRLILAKDRDNDGASDAQEILSGTDPENPDTDGDGALDGDEIANSYNPLVPDKFVRVDYADPRTVAPRQSDIYQVEKISAFALADNSIGFRLEGRGLPNSYVAVFIYSVPVVGIVKTGPTGAWSFDLDRPLSDGQHTAYVALVDSGGRIVARSEQFVFAKTGNTVAQKITNPEAEISTSVTELKSNFTVYLVFIVLLSLAIALLVIGFTTRARDGDRTEK
jgi:hypothetical protein